MDTFYRTLSYRCLFDAPAPGDCCFHAKVHCKGSPYSITECRVPELIPVLGIQPAGDVSHKHGVGCHYFPPGLQLPPQPLRGLLPILLLGEHRHNGVNSLPKTVTRHWSCDCDLNPGPSAPESSTLTTRLPSHPLLSFAVYKKLSDLLAYLLIIV